MTEPAADGPVSTRLHRLRTTAHRTRRRLHQRHPTYYPFPACRTGQHHTCTRQCSGLPTGLCCACNCGCHQETP